MSWDWSSAQTISNHFWHFLTISDHFWPFLIFFSGVILVLGLVICSDLTSASSNSQGFQNNQATESDSVSTTTFFHEIPITNSKFKIEIRETSQNFNSFRQLLHSVFFIGCLIELKFCEVTRNPFSNRCWKMLKTKKQNIPKRIFFKLLSISKQKSFV